MDPLEIAFFEPWYGGSHRSFLDTWSERSRHRITVYGLAPRHWKWRQEASAWELARRAQESPPPDLIACSDFVDLPRLMGFLPASWSDRPTLVYFHENQLTYTRTSDEGEAQPDFTHGFSNILSAIRAEAVVFNSEFHRGDFASAAETLLKRLPRPNPRSALRQAIERSNVVPPAPCLASVPLGEGSPSGAPLRIAFPHRLEPDKGPKAFLRAVKEARSASGLAFEVVLLGADPGQAAEPVQRSIEAALAEGWALHAGYCKDRTDYLDWLGQCDVVASTATHEFFGVAFAEAMAAGCWPLAPERLNYPELVKELPPLAPVLYGSEDDLASALIQIARVDRTERLGRRALSRKAVLPLDAGSCAARMDEIAARSATSRRP